MNIDKDRNIARVLKVTPRKDDPDSPTIDIMLRRATQAVSAAAVAVYGKAKADAFSICTDGRGKILGLKIFECDPTISMKQRPFFGDMLGPDGRMWEPVIEMMKNLKADGTLCFQHLGGRYFLDLTTRYLFELRV